MLAQSRSRRSPGIIRRQQQAAPPIDQEMNTIFQGRKIKSDKRVRAVLSGEIDFLKWRGKIRFKLPTLFQSSRKPHQHQSKSGWLVEKGTFFVRDKYNWRQAGRQSGSQASASSQLYYITLLHYVACWLIGFAGCI